MIKLPWSLEFDWDDGNRDKSRRDHDISFKETEQVFYDPSLRLVPDNIHSVDEERYLAYGHNRLASTSPPEGASRKSFRAFVIDLIWKKKYRFGMTPKATTSK